MNQLSPFVETVIKNYSNAALQSLFQHLNEHPGTAVVEGLGCGQNEAYVLKRLLNATLSREGDIKFNAYFALSTLLLHVPDLKNRINQVVLADYIISQTSINKHCGGKPSQIQAYSIGKVLIAKALHQLLVDNVSIINNLIDLSIKFPELEEQIIEVLSLLVKGKKSQLAFSKLNPITKSGFVLFTILRSQLKGVKAELNQAVVDDVLTELIPLYPKRSICLGHLGSQLAENFDWSQQYLKEKLSTAFVGEEENVDFKLIYYILQILESYLSSTTITKDNMWNILNSSIIEGWLSQLKVQNKYIRRQAQNITISFDNDPDMAFEILETLHKDKVNLANMNIKHPLFPLLEMVEPERYLNELLELCNKPRDQLETQEEDKLFPLNQLELFVSALHKKLKAESIAKVIEIFVREHAADKDDKHLQTLSRLFNSLLPESHKKKQQLLQKQSLILLKLNFEHIELGQFEGELLEAIKDIRKHFKQAKEEQHPLVIAYLNFMVSVGYYLLIHPQEVEIYLDIKMAFADIKKNFLSQSEGLQPKKKRKLNAQEEKNKPIHVLVDIFISLLTKSPQFLRNSINHLFEQIIPFITSEDIGHLLEVLEKPDQEYLEDVQNE